MLSCSQSSFFTAAVGGHNIVLTGQGGSGKSFVLNKFARHMQLQGKNVALTCSTGIGATQFSGGQTLHRWCGFGDGGIKKSELCELLRRDERYMEPRHRIKACDVLVVDECSMISKKMFETVDALCRTVRTNENYFGGIQLIFAGDFYQLPPVVDELYGETGQYCFESRHFILAIPHHIHLESIFRQTDSGLIDCINSLEKGTITSTTVQYIKKLKREIPQNENTVYLFAKNYKKDLFNHDKLNTFHGPITIYNSKDEGDSYYLQKFQAPKTLGLKVGCPIMLVINLSDSLVNGTMGKVSVLRSDEVVVYFDKVNQTVSLKRHLFSKVDPVSRKTLSKRLQFPLMLAFGITIHKSQGMTLQSVVVDCEDANIPGQIGVAVGRAVTANGLQVINFNPNLIKEHSVRVKQFYNLKTATVLPGCSCCKNEYLSLLTENDLFTPFDIDIDTESLVSLNSETDDAGDGNGYDNDDDDDDDNLDQLPLQQTNISEQVIQSDTTPGTGEVGALQSASPLPDYVNPSEMLSNCYAEYINSPLAETLHVLVNKITENIEPFNDWLGIIFLKFNSLFQSSFANTQSVELKYKREFCANVNSYLTSDIFFGCCNTILSKYDCDFGQCLLTSAAFQIQNLIITKSSETNTIDQIKERTIPSQKCEQGKGGLRYIGGYCVSKIKQKYKKCVQNSLFNFAREEVLEESRAKVLLLSQMVTTYSDLLDTSIHKETLETTFRKQNMHEGLTNITDEAYIFFEQLNNTVRKLETFENLYKHGEKTVEMIKSFVFSNSDIYNSWIKLFRVTEIKAKGLTDISCILNNVVTLSACITDLFYEIVTRFVKVSASHFRKDFLRHLKVEKSKAHRKKILEKKDKQSNKKVGIDEITKDSSNGKVVSHLKLKAGVVDDNEYFNDKSFTKKNLQRLCEAYEIPVRTSHNKKYLNDQLVSVIKQCDFMLTPSVFTSSVEGENSDDEPSSNTDPNVTVVVPTATQDKVKGKRKAKRKGTAKVKTNKRKKRKCSASVDETESSHCIVCHGQFDDSPDWVQCDGCDKWVHGSCVGITTAEHWEEINDEGVDFFCPFCK